MEVVSLFYGEREELGIMEMKYNESLNLSTNNVITLKNNVKAVITENGDMKMLVFQYNDVRVVIMGKLDKDELIKVANSMIE